MITPFVRYLTLLLIVLLTLSLTKGLASANEKHNQSFGIYSTEISATWLKGQSARSMRIDKTVTFTDPKGNIWRVPKGAVVDGASIPQTLQPFVGTPFVGNYRRATVFHDFYCDTKLRKWKNVHEMFYYAMRADGVSKTQAEIMWAAVRYFGPRWKGLSKSGKCIDSCDEKIPVKTSTNSKWFQKYVDWLEEDKWHLNFQTHQFLAEYCDIPSNYRPKLHKSQAQLHFFTKSLTKVWTNWKWSEHGRPVQMVIDFEKNIGCPPEND